MVLVSMLIPVISGVIGGNAAGGALRRCALGITGNSVLGALGGLCCSQLLGSGGPDSGSLELASMATRMLSSILGGSVLVMVVGLFRARRRAGRSRLYRTS
jgi:uncharacterized membrane protein YeaQ/YmgE (transglycosylase-associated protein family)